MWLVCLLIFIVANVLQGNFRPVSSQRRVKEIQAVSGMLKVATNKFHYNLKILIGDHYPMLLSFPPLPDLNSLESIKAMLQPGHSVSSLKDIHSQAGSFASVVMWYLSYQHPETSNEAELTFYEADTALQEFLHQVTKEFSDINKSLRDIEIFWFALWDSGSNEQLDNYNYVTNRKSISLLRELWSRWTFSLRQASEYDNFFDGCKSYDMNDWFSRFNETMNMWTNGGLRYPKLDTRERSLYTIMARLTKSDMSEATILLGVCDEILNASDNDKNMNMARVITIYERFAAMFREADKDLVINARLDIAQTTEITARAANSFRNGLSLAETIRRQLKEQFYWLDFTVLLFEAGERKSMKEWAVALSYTEYSNDKQDFCVIPVTYGMLANEEGTWRAIVYVGDLSSRRDTNDPLWEKVQAVVSECRDNGENCNAGQFFVRTTEMNGGMPMASYFLTASPKQKDTNYEVSGPVALPGRVEELKHFDFYIGNPRIFFQPVHVVAAAPCDLDIFTY